MPLWPPFTRLPCSASLFPCKEKGPARGLFLCRNRTSSHRERGGTGTGHGRGALWRCSRPQEEMPLFSHTGRRPRIAAAVAGLPCPRFPEREEKRGCRTKRHPRKHLWRNSGKGARRAGPWIMPREQRQPGICCRGSWYGLHPACRRWRLPFPSAWAAAAGWRQGRTTLSATSRLVTISSMLEVSPTALASVRP